MSFALASSLIPVNIYTGVKCNCVTKVMSFSSQIGIISPNMSEPIDYLTLSYQEKGAMGSNPGMTGGKKNNIE